MCAHIFIIIITYYLWRTKNHDVIYDRQLMIFGSMADAFFVFIRLFRVSILLLITNVELYSGIFLSLLLSLQHTTSESINRQVIIQYVFNVHIYVN